MVVRRSLAIGLGLSLLLALVGPGSVGAATQPDQTVTAASNWVKAQQKADGGFEVAGFTGFETSDAIFALASVAQTGPTWDKAAALAAVQAVENGGKDPLDEIDALVDGEADPNAIAAGARAAKVISLVASPLGLSATDFDPAGDSAAAVDLEDRMNVHRQGDGSYDMGAQFNGVLFAAIALDQIGQTPTAAHIAQITGGQRPDGSWDYTGGTSGPGDDIDTTALAIIALSSAGLTVADAPVLNAVKFMAARQQASGAWLSFGSADPNSTAVAALALADVHVDVSTPAWRSTYGNPAPMGYVTPAAWLASQQNADGHINSPNDSFGVNTLATSQSIQALSRQWYLSPERTALIEQWSADLGSPMGSPIAGAGADEASDMLGQNAADKQMRGNGAQALIESQAGREAAADDLFQDALGRGLDASGRAYWSNKLKTISRPEMLARLTGSSEFYRTAGGTTGGFVDAVYMSSLGRAAEPGGRAFWIRRIDNGASIRSVARALTASSEYRRRQVNGSYMRLLGRAATAGEEAYWTNKIATTRLEILLRGLGASGEYLERVTP